ncbi:Protein N-lysine methyltransferase METTL21A [Smittium culicis]|uniref:Protein N-lysine methyltransferase METTL21A n=1 Tax=Smittium culicis TaxID=133412 RepID=A0A1R1X068_9FUNG|nr:Protein N-lysine methyltransferase METTL21A [Smittium culicis]OMJ13558.1 Protein N-lysine methyltransferase METTL21A [Smittium culicis]
MHDLIRGKSVLELGSGTGLLGLVCSTIGATETLLTDMNKDVLNLLKINSKINSETAKCVSVKELDWFSDDDMSELKGKYDVIIGSDLVYDPDITPDFFKMLETLITDKKQMAYIASTVRREETYNQFTQLLESSAVLESSTMDITDLSPIFIQENSDCAVKLSIIALKQI